MVGSEWTVPTPEAGLAAQVSLRWGGLSSWGHRGWRVSQTAGAAEAETQRNDNDEAG